MKKLFCLLLACAMLLSLNAFASADDVDLKSALADLEIEAPEFEEPEKAVLDRAALAQTTDKVVVTDMGVKVTTTEGVCLSYTYPNENVLCITQDLEQQSWLYMCFYSNNMNSVASDFIADGMHLNVFDLETETDIYIYSAASDLAKVVPNLSVLSDDDVLVVQDAMQKYYFADANSVSVGTVGRNLWFFADYGSGGYLLTFVNGCEVLCSFAYVDSTGPVPALTLLDNLSVTAA